MRGEERRGAERRGEEEGRETRPFLAQRARNSPFSPKGREGRETRPFIALFAHFIRMCPKREKETRKKLTKKNKQYDGDYSSVKFAKLRGWVLQINEVVGRGVYK